jgi:hypothetical protein
MAQDYVHPLQALRAVMVQKRRVLADSLLRSRKGAKAARRRKKLIKLQREIDVIDDAIADEQLLSPSLREQGANSEDNTSSSVDTAAEPMERVKARLTELSSVWPEVARPQSRVPDRAVDGAKCRRATLPEAPKRMENQRASTEM